MGKRAGREAGKEGERENTIPRGIFPKTASPSREAALNRTITTNITPVRALAEGDTIVFIAIITRLGLREGGRERGGARRPLLKVIRESANEGRVLSDLFCVFCED